VLEFLKTAGLDTVPAGRWEEALPEIKTLLSAN
jgi:hypothetical protein